MGHVSIPHSVPASGGNRKRLTTGTEGTAVVPEQMLVKLIRDHFELTPKGIITTLNLRRPIYRESARHGHFGRDDAKFPWEKTDKAAALKKAAGV
jgi:S-adenosylmethionine synthetase